MLNSEQIYKHWVNCQTPTDPRYSAFIERGEEVAKSFKTWELAKIPIEEILNYQDSELENSGPLVTKIDSFLSRLKNINDLPPIILVPIDWANKRPFIEQKYDDPKLKWEAADGVHRLHLFLRLGLKEINSYVPVETTE